MGKISPARYCFNFKHEFLFQQIDLSVEAVAMVLNLWQSGILEHLECGKTLYNFKETC